MKKLQLRALQLGAKELLTREQLKNILGGNGSVGSNGNGGGGSGSGSTDPKCGQCNSHPGYTCALQQTSTSKLCMCGAIENYWYC